MPRISSSHQVEMEVNIEDGGEKQSKSGEVSNVEGLPSVNRTTINTVARIAQNSSLLIGDTPENKWLKMKVIFLYWGYPTDRRPL